jgi:hypothetical protein
MQTARSWHHRRTIPTINLCPGPTGPSPSIGPNDCIADRKYVPDRKAPLVATDADIYAQIKSLVDEEHALAGSADAADRRQQLEAQLDQCWDLLRQRQARREFGDDPADAQARPVGEVEGYLQ